MCVCLYGHWAARRILENNAGGRVQLCVKYRLAVAFSFVYNPNSFFGNHGKRK